MSEEIKQPNILKPTKGEIIGGTVGSTFWGGISGAIQGTLEGLVFSFATPTNIRQLCNSVPDEIIKVFGNSKPELNYKDRIEKFAETLVRVPLNIYLNLHVINYMADRAANGDYSLASLPMAFLATNVISGAYEMYQAGKRSVLPR